MNSRATDHNTTEAIAVRGSAVLAHRNLPDGSTSLATCIEAGADSRGPSRPSLSRAVKRQKRFAERHTRLINSSSIGNPEPCCDRAAPGQQAHGHGRGWRAGYLQPTSNKNRPPAPNASQDSSTHSTTRVLELATPHPMAGGRGRLLRRSVEGAQLPEAGGVARSGFSPRCTRPEEGGAG